MRGVIKGREKQETCIYSKKNFENMSIYSTPECSQSKKGGYQLAVVASDW